MALKSYPEYSVLSVENHVHKFKILSKPEHSQFNFPILV